jgi:poly(A) polymerase
MKLPDADWRRRPGMGALLRALGAGEGLTRYVGGCVRDTLLEGAANAAVSDVDLATRLTPTEVIRRLDAARIKAVPTGLAHGTVTAVSAGQPVEVTTLRRDVSTDGRRATVAFTEDWREDAARRDFTINALSADPGTGELFDYFGGLDDLAARRVRFIGDPLQRIAEDHLRILRFFRFHARFGAEAAPDADALAACTARANDLMALSRERIADELLKLLALPEPGPTVALMEREGILRPILPEVGSDGVARLAKLCDREKALGLAPDPLRRLAAVLPGAASAAIATRLRLSNKAVKRLAAINEPREEMAPEQLAYWIGPEAAADRILLGGGDPGGVGNLAGWVRPRLPVSGGQLIALGLPQGPVVARTLGTIERQWVAEGFPQRERLDAITRAAVDQALRSSQ